MNTLQEHLLKQMIRSQVSHGFVRRHLLTCVPAICYERPSYSYCKSNWKWQISKTIEISEVPDIPLDFRDESQIIKWFWREVVLICREVQVWMPFFKAETLAYLSANFCDGLSLIGAEIFALEICLDNHNNFEDKNSVCIRFIYLMMLISARSWALCV